MKQFDTIPTERPLTPLLDRIDSPEALRHFSETQLKQLADELRAYLLYTVGVSGGHFGAGLGVVELTTALHYALDTPEDRIVWDVGHQAYPHKILTGRRDVMHTMRQQYGLAAFPKRDESEFDTFGVGHSSTSISAALGMALAARNQNQPRRVCAVIGDGALTAGMAFEALAHAGHVNANMLVVLNDNEMSISENVGGIATYLSRILSSEPYIAVREGSKRVLSHLPGALDIARRTEEHVKGMVSPATLFEEMGFNYTGPVDGHDLPRLVKTLNALKDRKGPQFLHVVTKKGRGFLPGEQDPIGYHAITKLEKEPVSSAAASVAKPAPAAKPQKYCNVFGRWLCDMAAVDERLLAITPAMREGSDLVQFSKDYPARYFDVAIAEQHAVTLAAGMACEGAKPVVAIYSTFLQRGYDQLVHDVAVQNLDVTFAIDRAGLVGEDGSTHHGALDLSFLRCVPDLVIMAPSNESECRKMLTTAYHYDGPAAVRYPRGTGPGAVVAEALDTIEIGRAATLREGAGVALLAFGSMVTPALEVAERLDATVIDMRFVKPLDRAAVIDAAGRHELLVTVEENVVSGGAGSGVGELLASEGVSTPLLSLGIPDRFIEHGTPAELLIECGLDADGLEASIKARLG
ncbi:1-deoxy-D-xylulose-5-phosphate synthase [Larsenimonas suaedae]|uniref:1-deoxy-D-xylulose-5-phosphate synthase n=1 Tax=Larsenimonas suaedae TaxID=1851019 RepID=A0ABU1GRP5_9GAMM|nr:1-deoxy-D-xylulose-5-phosphate synthase [Larsenimonas suaedae]MCM2972509.1 1-deoxy-D-xylulose-5-phosphate synthase [Larsenimonas suaedae]MDR5894695.1 1-deoxy-D-xylulose-5-phosphate synthase [Larsenimonas suaedae]